MPELKIYFYIIQRFIMPQIQDGTQQSSLCRNDMLNIKIFQESVFGG